MKTIFRYLFTAVAVVLGLTVHAQLPDVVLQSGNYDKDPYPSYNPAGNITGSYSIQIAKSAHTFTDGQFTINVAFPPGAVYAGGGTLPSEFSVVAGQDGSSAVVIGLTGTWSGTGPTAIRNFVLPIKIVGPSTDQPTGTSLQWLDPFVTENPAGNTTGSPLNVNNALPVKLITFTATREGKLVLLQWATAEETGSDYFELQHSADAKTWAGIGRVSSAEESSIRRNYNYTHTNPGAGQNYYRLKMVDHDLTFAYSQIERVELSSAQTSTVRIYPNPVRAGSTLVIQADSHAQVERVEMVNSRGVVVQTTGGQAGANAIRVEGHSSGIYMTRIFYKDGTSTAHKVLVVK